MGSEGFSLFYWGLNGCLPPPPPQLGMKAAGTDRSGGNEGSPGGSYLPGLLTSSLTALKCQMDPALLLSPPPAGAWPLRDAPTTLPMAMEPPPPSRSLWK